MRITVARTSPPPYSYKTAFSIAVITFLVIAIAAVDQHGKNNRIFAQRTITMTVDSPEQAFAVWQANAVKGRVLLLFDTYPHMKGLINYESPPQLIQTNLIEYSLFNNIIRKIFLIVPDTAWDGFRQWKTIRPLRKVPGIESGLYAGSLSGVPAIVVTASSLPQMNETPLVYINNRLFDSEQVRALLSKKKISSDIFLVYPGEMQ